MEGTKLKGSFDVKLIGPEGELKEHLFRENLVTDGGLDNLIHTAFNTITGSSQFNYIAVGSDDTAAASGNTALGYALAVEQATYAHTDGEHNFSLTNTFGAGVGTGSVREYGVQNGSPTGVLFNRATFGEILKGASDTLQIVFAGSLT